MSRKDKTRSCYPQFNYFSQILRRTHVIMVKVNGGIESKISGMIGAVVFANFNGGTYVRQAPRTRSQNSWSSNQVRSRKRFSEVCVFWRKSIPALVKQVWNLAAEKMNGFFLYFKSKERNLYSVDQYFAI